MLAFVIRRALEAVLVMLVVALTPRTPCICGVPSINVNKCLLDHQIKAASRLFADR